MAETDNGKLFDEGMKKMKEIVDHHILSCLTEASYGLLVNAETEKEYHNLTGNTLTSLSVGIYSSGVLKRIVSIYDADSIDVPTRPKLSRGDGIGLIMVEDYDSGKFIPVRKYNLLDTDEDYGSNTSKRFLSQLNLDPKGWGIVMCTGTEYSSYLEIVKGMNVLTETFQISPKAIMMNLKPID